MFEIANKFLLIEIPHVPNFSNIAPTSSVI
jgi:hypothetical protein